jgi:hypothetical protein
MIGRRAVPRRLPSDGHGDPATHGSGDGRLAAGCGAGRLVAGWGAGGRVRACQGGSGRLERSTEGRRCASLRALLAASGEGWAWAVRRPSGWAGPRAPRGNSASAPAWEPTGVSASSWASGSCGMRSPVKVRAAGGGRWASAAAGPDRRWASATAGSDCRWASGLRGLRSPVGVREAGGRGWALAAAGPDGWRASAAAGWDRRWASAVGGLDRGWVFAARGVNRRWGLAADGAGRWWRGPLKRVDRLGRASSGKPGVGRACGAGRIVRDSREGAR